MVQTIEQNFGARIDYWAVTSFWGITRMVETIGGLQVRVPFRMKDASRSRTSARDSSASVGRRSWRSPAIDTACPAGTSAARRTGVASSWRRSIQFKKEFRKNPSRLLTWIAAGVRNTESNLPVDELVDLAFGASRIASRT